MPDGCVCAACLAGWLAGGGGAGSLEETPKSVPAGVGDGLGQHEGGSTDTSMGWADAGTVKAPFLVHLHPTATECSSLRTSQSGKKKKGTKKKHRQKQNGFSCNYHHPPPYHMIRL